MKHIFKKKLNQFVIIPTIGFSWESETTAFHFTWLRCGFHLIIARSEKKTPFKDEQTKMKNGTIRHTCRLLLNQFVIIPTIGITWQESQIHFFTTWLRSRMGFVISKG